jgi:hypothetical protein
MKGRACRNEPVKPRPSRSTGDLQAEHLLAQPRRRRADVSKRAATAIRTHKLRDLVSRRIGVTRMTGTVPARKWAKPAVMATVERLRRANPASPCRAPGHSCRRAAAPRRPLRSPAGSADAARRRLSSFAQAMLCSPSMSAAMGDWPAATYRHSPACTSCSCGFLLGKPLAECRSPNLRAFDYLAARTESIPPAFGSRKNNGGVLAARSRA